MEELPRDTNGQIWGWRITVIEANNTASSAATTTTTTTTTTKTTAPKPTKPVKRVNKKRQSQIRALVRFAIQLVFFILMPSAYSSAFSGVKYLLTQIGNSALLSMVPFITILIVLLAYTIVFGRFFCGYACAFGALGDWIHALHVWICKKRKKKPVGFPEWPRKWYPICKYFVLGAILYMCWNGTYGNLPKWNPWEVFSMIRAGNFNLSSYGIGCLILALIVVGMFFEERFFCKFLCPMGAVFSLMPVLPYFTLHRNRPECIKGCNLCERTCPCNVKLPTDGSYDLSGECIYCEKCVGVCPKSNIHCGVSNKLHGNEIWFTLLRAGILLGLLYLIGV